MPLDNEHLPCVQSATLWWPNSVNCRDELLLLRAEIPQYLHYELSASNHFPWA
jgi:hypothetical protein